MTRSVPSADGGRRDGSRGPHGDAWRHYRVFGLRARTNLRLRGCTPIPEGRGAGEGSDLTIELTRVSSLSRPQGEPLYVSPVQLADARSILTVFQPEGGLLLRFTDVADFEVGRNRIDCFLTSGADEGKLERWLLTAVLATYLERRGTPVLHGSAVSVDGSGVVFLGQSTAGKSSVAAAFVRAGHRFLCDDLVAARTEPAHILVEPGRARMGLWPDTAEHFVRSDAELERVHPSATKLDVPLGGEGLGGEVADGVGLRCIYTLERRASPASDDPIEIRPFGGRDAVIELVRHSYLTRLIEPLGLSRDRLEVISGIARQVPVRRLIYLSGLAQLPNVVEAVTRDLAELSRA